MRSIRHKCICLAAAALMCGTSAAVAQTYVYPLPPGGFSPSQTRLQPVLIAPARSPVAVTTANGSVVMVRPATTFATPRIVQWNLSGLPAGARNVPPPPAGGGATVIPVASGGMPSPSGGASSPYGGMPSSSGRTTIGPSSGPIGTPIMVQLAQNLGATPTLLRFRAVVTNGVPAQLLSQLLNSGGSYSTPAPIQLCIRGGGRWDVDLLLSNGVRLDSIGSFTPTNCP